MTQADQRQQSAPNTISNLPRAVSTNPSISLKPITDSISDNDTSEKPVREKLKKTSLASMSNDTVQLQERISQENEQTSTPDHLHRDSSLERQAGVETRGRPVKKRSFDDLDTPETEVDEGARGRVKKLNANGHLRKRSKDVPFNESPKDYKRSLSADIARRDDLEDTANGVKSTVACFNGSQTAMESETPIIETLSQEDSEQDKQPQVINEPVQSILDAIEGISETEKEFADQEMRDPTSSPRKKRSRDQFDTEADREQKIPATEEARAHRRSDELERSVHSVVRSLSPPLPKDSGVVEREPVTEEKQRRPDNVNVGLERLKRPSGSAFGSANTLSSSLTFARSSSPVHLSTSAPTTADQAPQIPPDAFEASGFAALAASSTSPFGTLAGSSNASSVSPFASAGVLHLGKTETSKKAVDRSETAADGGPGPLLNSSSTAFGVTVKPPFGTSGSNNAGFFGGSVLGSAFGGSFSGGNVLTTFAAPSGNARLGASNVAIKPIGSPQHGGDENGNSESDCEVSTGIKEEESEETDGRFQQQDVETGEGGEESIFSSRASLYSFRDNAWKESGKGIFKLNITTASLGEVSSTQKTGRFIMRAHQTYRVLLNVPVFKQMQIGDSKGNEPSGKSFLFAVIENAKPIAHMVKLGDGTDSKTLYHEVKRLQKDLE